MVYTYQEEEYIIGIDPGFTGAIAVLRLNDKDFFVEVIDTPTKKVPYHTKTKITTRTVFVPELMRNILKPYKLANTKIVIEDVTARSGQGVVSMFRFGHGLGLWEGLMVGLDMPYIKILPVEWKRTMGLLKTEKEQALITARELFPDAPLKLQKHHGRADALLIAEAYRRAFICTR